MKFQIGDKVSFLNEKRSGIVTHILGTHRVMVTNEDGFDIPVSIDQIVLKTEISAYKVDPKKMNEKEEREVKPPKLSVDEAWEVDLHLDNIIDTGKAMSDHEKLLSQLKYFRKCMEAAITHRIKKIIFIHGVGKGTLKEEIIHLLKDYDRIRHYAAPFRKYGYGALVVEFYN